ncbi:MAG: ImmA/IrrE family metallo-endopeptidase [Patescibacteria group bacterium]|nr:ImmA/IrrE family metallo-endopeptidase [Patescibacteria group bacterium]
MKSYERINLHAENIAKAIYDSIEETMPSEYSLIKWVEENFGIKMKIFHTESSEFKRSGLEFFDPQKNIFQIWINSKEPGYRQRYTLCHEIAHIIRNSGLKYGFSSGDIYSAWGEERFCERFAAAFLMPRDLFIRKWNSIPNGDIWKKARLAKFFGVSGDAVYYREKELKLIQE